MKSSSRGGDLDDGRPCSAGALIERQRLRAVTGIVGQTDAMHQVLARGSWQIAPVHLDGPGYRESPGTGKELVARGIHALSSAKAQAVHCGQRGAALSETLLESELFGHEKGAFTGGNRLPKGSLRVGPWGGTTIFLDEIGEMPLATQTKLLRVPRAKRVSFGSVERQASIKVDVSNRGCDETRICGRLVAIGDFRRDLYFRLNVLGIELPALRERRVPIYRFWWSTSSGMHPTGTTVRSRASRRTRCSY